MNNHYLISAFNERAQIFELGSSAWMGELHQCGLAASTPLQARSQCGDTLSYIHMLNIVTGLFVQGRYPYIVALMRVAASGDYTLYFYEVLARCPSHMYPHCCFEHALVFFPRLSTDRFLRVLEATSPLHARGRS